MSDASLFVFFCVAVLWSTVVTLTMIWLIRRSATNERLALDARNVAEQAGLAAIEANPSRVNQLASSLDNHLQEHAARTMYAAGTLNASPNLRGAVSPPQDHDNG